MVATLQRHHRRAMDRHPIRRQPRLPAFACHCRGVCADRLPRLSRLWLYRPGQVCHDIHPLGNGIPLYTVPCAGAVCPAHLRHCLHPRGGLLHYHRRHDQHRTGRSAAVYHHDPGQRGHRRHCHDSVIAKQLAGAGRVDESLFRLASESGLVRHYQRSQRQDRRRSVRLFYHHHDADAVQRHSRQRGRAGAQL